MNIKKSLLKTVAIIMTVTGGAALTSCNSDNIIYQPTTRFMYNTTDGTGKWSETIQEVSVSETYWLRIEMSITQSRETKDEKSVEACITIPNTNVLDCYLDDHPGVTVTGIPDPINNSITYKFNVVSSATAPSKFGVVFECTPLDEGKASIYVVYDDKVSPNWDATGTIKYVAATSSQE